MEERFELKIGSGRPSTNIGICRTLPPAGTAFILLDGGWFIVEGRGGDFRGGGTGWLVRRVSGTLGAEADVLIGLF